MAEKAGFIGLGNIGNPMSRNVLKAGFPLVVSDVNPAAIDSGSAGAESECYQAV
jgi:2-hydroxy-3-oxopropionate reductase